MSNKYNKRELISFDGKCPLRCKYCYTYDLDEDLQYRNVEELVYSIAGREFDIIYLSQTYENFFDQQKGINLCEELYKQYRKDIFIITKSSLDNATIIKLADLNFRMMKNKNQLYLGVSVCANESYEKIERVGICPSPLERVHNLEIGFQLGIKTLLLLRPIFPNSIIPVKECIDLLNQIKSNIYAVVSSGLIITPRNIKELGLEKDSLYFLENGDSDYLANIERSKINFVNVEEELKTIQKYCEEQKIPFFRHSMPALNFIEGMMAHSIVAGNKKEHGFFQ